jgi:vacuolar-type H+-ATPase subunit C/Vma6
MDTLTIFNRTVLDLDDLTPMTDDECEEFALVLSELTYQTSYDELRNLNKLNTLIDSWLVTPNLIDVHLN